MEDHNELTNMELCHIIDKRFEEYLRRSPDPSQILYMITRLTAHITGWAYLERAEASMDRAVELGDLTKEEADEMKRRIRDE